jgi:hypothetical protein
MAQQVEVVRGQLFGRGESVSLAPEADCSGGWPRLASTCDELRATTEGIRPCCKVCHERGAFWEMLLDGQPVRLCCNVFGSAIDLGPARVSFDPGIFDR